MTKLKCICGEKFEDFKSYAEHAKNCVIYQMKQSREANERIKNEIGLSD